MGKWEREEKTKIDYEEEDPYKDYDEMYAEYFGYDYDLGFDAFVGGYTDDC